VDAPTGAKTHNNPKPKNEMKRIAAILALIMTLTLGARADEIFYATHNTGTQTSYSNVDLYYVDSTANMTGIGSNWNLIFANWGAGIGYASIDIATNNPTGWYNVGTVNSTGQTIWAVLN